MNHYRKVGKGGKFLRRKYFIVKPKKEVLKADNGCQVNLESTFKDNQAVLKQQSEITQLKAQLEALQNCIKSLHTKIQKPNSNFDKEAVIKKCIDNRLNVNLEEQEHFEQSEIKMCSDLEYSNSEINLDHSLNEFDAKGRHRRHQNIVTMPEMTEKPRPGPNTPCMN